MIKENISYFFHYYTIFGGILGASFTIALNHLFKFYRRPKIKLQFDKANGGIRTASWLKEDGAQVVSKFVRITISNLGKESIKNAKIYLYEIYKIEEGILKETDFIDPKGLSWSASESDFEARNIPPELKISANIVSFETDSNWIFRTEDFLSSELSVMSHKGTYRMHFIATSENAKPKKISLDITFKGDLDSISAIEIKTNHFRRKISRYLTIILWAVCLIYLFINVVPLNF